MADPGIMRKFLKDLGCRKARLPAHATHGEEWYILDGFDHNMYLAFDLTVAEEFPESIGTVDIFACKPGEHVMESKERIQLMENCKIQGVMRLLFALGIKRFSEKTRSNVYISAGTILRDET